LLDPKPLTIYELLSLLVSLFGFVAVVISLWFLKKQTAASAGQTAMLAEAVGDSPYATLGEHLTTINQVFIDHPETRPHFYDNMPMPEGDVERSRVLAVAETLLDFMDSIIYQRDRLVRVYGVEWWECWRTYIRDSFAASDVLCQHLDDRQSWYSDELHELAGEARRSTQVSANNGIEQNARR